MEVANGPIGSDGKYDIKLVDGKLVMALQYAGGDVGAELLIKYDALKLVNSLVDAIEKAIPGDQSAMAIMLKQALQLSMK